MVEAMPRAQDEGGMPAVGLNVDDCQKTYEDLGAKGVEFIQAAVEAPLRHRGPVPRQLRATGSSSSSRASGYTADDFAGALEELQQLAVELLGVLTLKPCGPPSTTAARCGHLLVGALARHLERHDAVGVAVDDQGRHGDLRQVVAEVGRAEGRDAVASGVHVGAAGVDSAIASWRCSSVTFSSPSAEKKLRDEAVEERRRGPS